jgi:hypothetical protein
MKKAATYLTRLIVFGCCIFFAPFLASAQTRGKVEVIKDPLIDTFAARRSALSKNIPLGTPDAGGIGFRVQIYFGSSRQAAYNAQAKFMNEFPEVPTYISYIEPNFKVQAGDFRTKLEAQKLQSELNGMFSTLFIIPTKINPPKSESSND